MLEVEYVTLILSVFYVRENMNDAHQLITNNGIMFQRHKINSTPNVKILDVRNLVYDTVISKFS